MLGSFLGDFTKGSLDGRTDEISHGILIHRKLDAFSDHDDAFLNVQRRFPKNLSRYSGILLDIFMDHALSTQWEEWTGTSLIDYQHRIWKVLDAADLPVAAHRFVDFMKRHNLPFAYREMHTIRDVLHGISRYRMKRKNPIMDGFPFMLDHYAPLLKAVTPLFHRLRHQSYTYHRQAGLMLDLNDFIHPGYRASQ